MSNFHVVILAAGKGTRMKSSLPKVLAPLAGKAMLAHVIDTAKQLSPSSIKVVIGHGADQVKQTFSKENVDWVIQEQQNGTGNAVKQAIPSLPSEDNVIVLYGDVPLISTQTLQQLLAKLKSHKLTVLTAKLADPSGYGRIIRDENDQLCSIIEQKDASIAQQAIDEINTGFLAANVAGLTDWLSALNTNNAQGEEYLTDVVSIAHESGEAIGSVKAENLIEIQGVNSKLDLASIERQFQLSQAQHYMEQGLTIIDPNRFDVRGSFSFGQDCQLDINVIIQGNVNLGNNVTIHANCILSDCDIGDNTEILPNTVLENCQIGNNVNIGPFARIRPGTTLANDSKVGNFVELKNTRLSSGSKVNHLSYVGDSQVGENTNIGAGVITCNYDGANKHQTIIGDNAFIGSNTQLVAPVKVENGATVAAGSTITQTVPEKNLAVARSKQKNLAGWQRPKKK